MQIINSLNYVFSKNNKPVAKAKSGEILLFKTEDCFGGQITKESQLMHDIDFEQTNPTSGPVFVEGAEPGDVLVAEILDIEVRNKGASCSIDNIGPLHDISETRTRIIEIQDGYAKYNDISWKVEPMIGVIGTAPIGDDVPSGLAGDHGGNMDSKLIVKGSKVYLPVRVQGGLFQVGDLHASMGDGEVSGTGLEVGGDITIRLSVIKDFELNWPVTETDNNWYVNTTSLEYGESLVSASKELCRLMKPVYKWDETDIFIYLSLQGDVGVNQGVYPIHSPMFTLRFGIPKSSERGALIK